MIIGINKYINKLITLYYFNKIFKHILYGTTDQNLKQMKFQKFVFNFFKRFFIF